MPILNIALNLILLIKSYEAEKIYLILEHSGKHPLKVIESQRKSHHRIQIIRKPDYGIFNLLSTKMWNFVFFARRPITGACSFVCLFVFSFLFPRGDRIDPVVLECCERAYSNEN